MPQIPPKHARPNWGGSIAIARDNLFVANDALLALRPALAQGSPSAAQYQGGGSRYCPPNTTCAESLGDGADDFSENAEQGTGAVNDAMEGVPSNASAISSDASTPAAPAFSAGGPAAHETGGPDGITALPETGGASLAALGSGMLLTAFGLMALRRVG